MFKLDSDNIKTNILSKFPKDWVKTVTASVNEKIVDDGRTDGRTADDGHSSIPKFHPEQSSGELIYINIVKRIFAIPFSPGSDKKYRISP